MTSLLVDGRVKMLYKRVQNTTLDTRTIVDESVYLVVPVEYNLDYTLTRVCRHAHLE